MSQRLEKDKSDDTLAYEDSAHKVILRTFSYFLKIVTHIGQGWSIFLELFFKKDGAFPSDDATNVTKIVKDSSDDTLAYKDNAHEVILHTFSYFLKIATATHIDQRLSIFSWRSIRKRVRLFGVCIILNNKHINLVEDCFNVTLAYDDQSFVLNNIGFIVPLDLKQTPR